MFRDWFSGELRVWYLRSRHKDRVDHVGSCLQKRRYLPEVVRQQLDDSGRFVRHLEKKPSPCRRPSTTIRSSGIFRNSFRLELPADGEPSVLPSGSSLRWTAMASLLAVFNHLDGQPTRCTRKLSPAT